MRPDRKKTTPIRHLANPKQLGEPLDVFGLVEHVGLQEICLQKFIETENTHVRKKSPKHINMKNHNIIVIIH